MPRILPRRHAGREGGRPAWLNDCGSTIEGRARLHRPSNFGSQFLSGRSLTAFLLVPVNVYLLLNSLVLPPTLDVIFQADETTPNGAFSCSRFSNVVRNSTR